MSDNMSVASGSMDDTLIISDSSDVTVDLGYFDSHTDYAAAQTTLNIGNIETITLDSSLLNTTNYGSTLSWSSDYSLNSYPSNTNVNINSDGITMQQDSDLKIGDRSLKDFMNNVENQLAILRPAPDLEEKWDRLRDLRRQYEECKQDILEKEKIMKILKEQ